MNCQKKGLFPVQLSATRGELQVEAESHGEEKGGEEKGINPITKGEILDLSPLPPPLFTPFVPFLLALSPLFRAVRSKSG
jgi:hypothetical protein